VAEYTPHTPALLAETLEHLAPAPGRTILDATAGSGAATAAIADRVSPGGCVLALDRDPEAVVHLAARFADEPAVRVLRGDFREADAILDAAGIRALDGALLDLGVSFHQLEPGAGRGFSFRDDEPLDMRMDRSTGESACSLIARLDEAEMSAILRDLGEERHHRRVAAAICRERARATIATTGRLAQIVRGAIPGAGREAIDPATRSFMALRIAVNGELDALADALPALLNRLAPGGRLVVISYHSLEDRIVKLFLRAEERGCTCPPRQPLCTCGRRPTLSVLTRRPVRPGDDELAVNPRARSAKLRAGEALSTPEEAPR
jgi:16S rRNA (cytosine1402-N4)-methyltransferase